MKKPFFLYLTLILIVIVGILSYHLSAWQLIVDYQRSGTRVIIGYIQSLRENFTLGMATNLFFFSMLYGIIHAVGPGHGKVIISTYLINRKQNIFKAFLISIIASFFHVGIAILISFLLKTFFTGIGHFARINMIDSFKLASGILISIIGLLLLFEHLLKLNFIKRLSASIKNPFVIGVLAGMIPCPLTMTIMLISISYSIYYVGLTSASGIFAGIFISLFAISLFVLFLRNLSLGTSGKSGNLLRSLFFQSVHYLQSGLFMIIGAVLIYSYFY